jgi:hypothetical protein
MCVSVAGVWRECVSAGVWRECVSVASVAGVCECAGTGGSVRVRVSVA